jgi:hypothetical protein
MLWEDKTVGQKAIFVTNPVTAKELSKKYEHLISYSSITKKTQTGDIPYCATRPSRGILGFTYLYDPKIVAKWMKNYKKQIQHRHVRRRGTFTHKEPKRKYDCINYGNCLSKAMRQNAYGTFSGCKKCGKYAPEPEQSLQERLEFAMCCVQLWRAVCEIPEDEAIL